MTPLESNVRHMGLVQCKDDPCRFYLKENRANLCILRCPFWPLLVRFRLLIVFAHHIFSLTADALSSTIKPIQVVLPHQRDQLVGVIRRGGVTGLVDLASERVRIGLELQARAYRRLRRKNRACSEILCSKLSYLAKSALTVTHWPLINSRVGARTEPAGPRPLMPNRFLASPIVCLPQPVSIMAWATVTDAGTPVSAIARLALRPTNSMNCSWSCA